MKPLTLEQAAKICGGELVGDKTTVILGFCSIENQQQNALTFVSHTKFGKLIDVAKGAYYIVPETLRRDVKQGIVHDNPTQAFRLLLAFVYKSVDSKLVAKTAIIDDSVQLGQQVSVGHNTVIEAGVVLGDGCVVGDNCFIGRNVKIGRQTKISHRVSIHHECILGDNCIIADGTVIGGQGFGFSFEGGQWEAVPQIGRVVISNKVHIGSNVCIDRGAIDDTTIGNNVIIDNLVHIAHNVRIGDGCAFAAEVGIAGSTTIGKHCLFGGQVGIAGHISITDGVQINGGAKILQSITEPGAYAGAFQVMPVTKWNRMALYLRKIEQLFRKEVKK